MEGLTCKVCTQRQHPELEIGARFQQDMILTGMEEDDAARAEPDHAITEPNQCTPLANRVQFRFRMKVPRPAVGWLVAPSLGAAAGKHWERLIQTLDHE